MKRLLFGLMLLILNGMPAFGWDLPLDFSILGIRFNHNTSSSANDAITIRKDCGETVITTPEYTGGQNEKVAYAATVTNPTIKVMLSMGSDIADSVRVKAYCTNGNLFDLQERAVNINGSSYSIADPGNPANYVTFKKTTSYSLQTTVTKCTNAQLAWKVTKILNYTFPTPVDVGTTYHTVYTLLNTPQSPMTEPWTEVLDYACEWASGASTNAGVVSNITTGAYNSGIKDYNYNYYHCIGTTFYLTEFLSATYCDCRDMSAVVQVFSNALGVNQVYVKTINIVGGTDCFYLKSIDPIGDPDWTGETKYNYWYFHQVGWYNSLVYDACLRLNYLTPRISTGESITGSYRNDLWNSNPSFTPEINNIFNTNATSPFSIEIIN
jgi:hypothetical protein